MKKLAIFIPLIFLSSCIGSAYYKKLNNDYFLSATDVREDMVFGGKDLGYDIGIVNATVFAAGQNEDFIILKQHPRIFPEAPDRTITNFFIVPLKNKISNNIEKNIFGPLTMDEFENKKKELGVADIEFTIVFDDLK